MCTINYIQEDDKLISLGLSVRAYNYCQRNKITTVSGLIEYFKINEFSIPYGANAGKTTVEELSRVCRELLLSDSASEIEDGDLNTIKLWGLSTRAYNYCQSLRLTSKNSLLKYFLSNNSSIPPIANVGTKTINELEALCKKLLKANPLIADTKC